MGKIIIGGNQHKVGTDIKLWTDTGLEFVPGYGARPRRSKIDLVVWHYTGGEGNAVQLHRVLTNRGLGIEFFIDREGVIWQFCDPAVVDTFDAGSANRRSVGIEIACYGFRNHPSRIPRIGKDRKVYDAVVHGRKIRMADFYPCQVTAAIKLADALSSALDVPRTVPLDETGLLDDVLSVGRLEAFSGHLGHYHLTKRKLDPGPKLMVELLASFRKPETSGGSKSILNLSSERSVDSNMTAGVEDLQEVQND